MSQTPESPSLDPVARFLLDYLAERASAAPDEVARAFAALKSEEKKTPVDWRPYLNTVKQQALYLVKQGRIELLRKGNVITPDQAKGLIRYRLTLDPPAQ